MSALDEFLDRAAARITELARRVERLRDSDPRLAGDLAAGVHIQRERLTQLRRMGTEATPEMTQSLAVGLERLSARLGGQSAGAA